MYRSRSINTKINNLHYRALRMIYKDDTSSFEELLERDGSITIHHQNIHSLATEMFKVVTGVAPSFMEKVFNIHPNHNSQNVSAGTRKNPHFYNPNNPKKVNNGLKTLRNLGPKIWNMVPNDIKRSPSLVSFKNKISKWIPSDCPCKLCAKYVANLGFI